MGSGAQERVDQPHDAPVGGAATVTDRGATVHVLAWRMEGSGTARYGFPNCEGGIAVTDDQ